ncbi:hypothetical protein NQZ68_000778 [Dissostichus eleginoides]|nr:hypothetical protein NQZ68_000778 [Dissostichus eleginoides]
MISSRACSGESRLNWEIIGVLPQVSQQDSPVRPVLIQLTDVRLQHVNRGRDSRPAPPPHHWPVFIAGFLTQVALMACEEHERTARPDDSSCFPSAKERNSSRERRPWRERPPDVLELYRPSLVLSHIGLPLMSIGAFSHGPSSQDLSGLEERRGVVGLATSRSRVRRVDSCQP